MKKTLISLCVAIVAFLFAPNVRAEYTDDCITFSSAASFTLKTNNEIKNWDGTLWTSTDKVNWTEWNGKEVSAAQLNDIGIYNLNIRGSSSNARITGNNYGAYWCLEGLSSIACSGNIETLRGATGDAPSPTPMEDYCYSYNFYGCTLLTNAPALPATTLAKFCYRGMFDGCSSLMGVPVLPATTLAECCYKEMFRGCASLTTPPTLPAMTLSDGCYNGMFWECTALTNPPALPAAMLAVSCYDFMFYDCTSLTMVPDLPATTLAKYCYYAMFHGCTALEVNDVLPGREWRVPATTGAEGWGSSMFTGTAGTLQGQPALNTTYYVTSAPAEPIEDCISFSSEASFTLKTWNTAKNWDGTLWTSTDKVNWTEWNGAEVVAAQTGGNGTHNLYVRGNTSNTMITGEFAGMWVLAGSKGIACSGNIETLRGATGSAPSLTKMANECYAHMFDGCTSLVSAPVLPATALADGCYRHMFVSCSALTNAPALPATTLADYCYSYMFSSCSALTKAPVLPATTLAECCYCSMFSDCTSLTDAPVLPAMTLSLGCYCGMFYGCTSLTNAPALPATTLADHCYDYMFRGCMMLEVNEVTPGKEWKIPATSTTAERWGLGMFDGTAGTLQGQPELNATYYIKSAVPPMPTDDCITFSSAASFTLKTWNTAKNWDGTLWTSPDKTNWTIWQGKEVGAAQTGEAYCLYVRGNTRNAVIAGSSAAYRWVLAGSKIACTGNIETLRGATGDAPSPTKMADDCYSYMFYGCTSLVDIPTLPATRLTPGCYSSMFYGCTLLAVNVTAPGKEWKIPAISSLYSSWGRNMFTGTAGTLQGQPELNTTYFIASGLLPEGGPYKETIDGIEWTFMVDANLDAIIGANGTAIPQATEGAIVIPSALGGRAVVRIGDWAFSGCGGLASVSIPSSVTYIGFEAFASCSGLTSLMIPASVTVIAPAFTGCNRLNSIEVEPANVIYTSQDGVLFDKNMEAIVKCPNGRQGVYTIPSSVTTVKESAFKGCGGLTSLTIPSSVTSIGNSAFYGCSGLSGLAIPSSVTSIGDRAFYGCSSLTSMTIPSSVKCIGSQVFRECRSLTNISIPSSVVSIGDGAFEDCDSLGSVTIPSSVTSIGDCAFIYCDNLESVTIRSGVASIGSLAFSGCGKLTNLTIPSSVTSIGEWAFGDCNSLTSVDFEGAPPTGVGGAGFCTDATIRYNIGYEAEWLPVIEACGWTNAKAYTPIKITNVTAQQRYPWNGKVDITFAVENAGSEACELFIRATDMTTGKTTVASNVSGDAECTSGLHHVVWDMVADGLTLVSSNVVFSVSYKEQKRPDGLYCVIDLSGGSSATTYPITDLDDVPSGGWGDEYKTTKLVLRRIDPGTCVVTVDKPYYVGVFEVTQKQYELVTGETPSRFSGDVKRPVEYVSYDMIRGSNKGAQYPDSTDVDADSFMGKLRSRTGLHVDLPTEAQWEYAGRAGEMTGYYFGDFANGDYMWYSSNSGSCPHEVGTRKPNAWGLYDVHGNVFERCLEWHSAGLRVLRGGGWFDGDGGCSFYYRAGFDPSDPNDNIGFRLVSTTAEASIAATTATLGISDPVRIDLTEGTRTAAATEIITYSTEWGDCASADAVAVVSVDGAVVSEASGRGTIEWRPTSGGIHTLTHKMMSGQTQLGEMLTATFVVVVPVKPGEEIVVQEGKAEAKATEINSDPGVKAQYLKAPEGVETTAEYLSYFKAVATSGSTVGFVLNEQGTNEVMNATVAVKTTTLDVVLSADSTVVIDKPLAGFYYSLKQGGDVSVGDRADLNKLGGRDLISFELTKEPLRYFYKTLVTPTPVPAE